MKTLYYNAFIYTGTLPLQNALLTEDEKILWVGSDCSEITAEIKIDLGGSFVCAGFNDSHMHLLNYGQSLIMAPLHKNTNSLEQMLTCLKTHLQLHPPAEGQWLTGRGWNQDYFSDMRRMPNRYDLDTVSTEIPILAVRACGHAVSINSKAMECIGLTADTPQPDGGEIVTENGIPNGILLDNAVELAYEKIPAPKKDELKSMIRQACTAANRYGVTSVQSDDYCVFSGVSWQTVNEAFRELEAEGSLTVRVYEQANFTNLSELKEFIEDGNVTGQGSEFFKIGPLKMLGDGALGARTAYLSVPYADSPDTQGIPVFSQQTLDEMIGYAHSHGMQTAVHAIGDACLDRVLSAMEKALAACPRTDTRSGIVHCQITRPEQLEKLANMKAHIYAQSIFLDYDISIVHARAGEALASTSYSWKTLKNMGATISNGTDCPVELPFALGGIQCAVTRQPLSGALPAYLPQEAFTLQEALDSYTYWGAYASFEENIKGKLMPGMLADFVVLSQNPFDTQPSQIKDIPIRAVYLGGKCVYSNEQEKSL